MLNWTQKDYRGDLREIAALEPDVLCVGVRYGVAVKLARQAPEILPQVRLVGTEMLYMTDVGPDPAARPSLARCGPSPGVREGSAFRADAPLTAPR